MCCVLSTNCVVREKVTEDFKHGQLEALLAVAHGKNAFVCMHTGGRKSMCMFMLPLLTNSHAVCVVNVFDGATGES